MMLIMLTVDDDDDDNDDDYVDDIDDDYIFAGLTCGGFCTCEILTRQFGKKKIPKCEKTCRTALIL